MRLALLGLILMLPHAACAACLAEHARYVSVDDAKFTAGFAVKPPGGEWRSDLAFYLHSAGSQRTFWFLFDAGSANYMNLISMGDINAPGWQVPGPDERKGRGPLMSMHYLQGDAGLHFRYDAPVRGQPALPYIFLPDLAETMWYSANPRESAPAGIFKLTGCSQ
jgi:hypothetical protein